MALATARASERARRLWRLEPWARLGALLLLLAVPVLTSTFTVLDLAAKVALFATLVAAYDVLIGFTGIVSFGHGMFFGLGAYAVGLALGHWGAPTYAALAAGLLVGLLAAAALAFAIGAFSLRVKALFFAMITLAFAEFALILAVQLSWLTGGEDGVTLRMPGALAGRLTTYYTLVAGCAVLFLMLSRFVRSPLGRTLQGIRDNALRAEALGYRTFVYQSIATALAGGVAALAGGGYVMWVRYVNPESVLGIPIMLDVLLMVIIGGIGTLDGAIVGAAVLLTARTLLPDLRAVGAAWFPASELAQRLLERWQLYFGVLFILVVFFFPRGIIGTLRGRPERGGVG